MKKLKIGLFLPSLLNTKRFGSRIFAPGELFEDLARELVRLGHEVYVYGTIAKIGLVVGAGFVVAAGVGPYGCPTQKAYFFRNPVSVTYCMEHENM